MQYVVREKVYGLDGETWDQEIGRFETLKEAQDFEDSMCCTYSFIEEEEDAI